ncbi:FAD-dependent oxidoreductase [Streptomyces sp. R21]|uniref:FAD-dependent oxidoreductase n=1 Tax=Streptomyces sp. R21 TaxID=3238627 RepID=A0AB39NZP0_9ACTN
MIVLGAGLAGLCAAGDLAAAGTDVLVLEARDRVGGRVGQTRTPDGRTVQLRGEVVGRGHTAYLQLAKELRLELVPSHVAEPGRITRATPEGRSAGEPPHWFGPGDTAQLRTPEPLAEMAAMFGDEALRPTACHLRPWGTDLWTQGYVTQWPPGEVMAVGPLHGTHEPPFYVCGSDQWVAGYVTPPRRGRRGFSLCRLDFATGQPGP